jgi:hypothetical protein
MGGTVSSINYIYEEIEKRWNSDDIWYNYVHSHSSSRPLSKSIRVELYKLQFYVFIGVKLSLSPQEKYRGSECFRWRCWGEQMTGSPTERQKLQNKEVHNLYCWQKHIMTVKTFMNLELFMRFIRHL